MGRARPETTAGRILVDGGQTGTRVRVETPEGTAEHLLEPIRTDRPVVEQVVAAVRGLQLPESVTVLAAGLSGLTPQAVRREVLRDEMRSVGIASVVLAHDSVTAYLAANGTDPGSVAAVGTGVVTLGVGPGGVHRVDGWGHLVGDAGSAYWIGRAGLDAALRAFDGRGRGTVLEHLAGTALGPLPELYMTIQADPDRVARVAGFARAVDEAAADGDLVAGRILDDAADELTASIRAALHRSGHRPGAHARVSWMGTVMESNRRIRDRVAGRIADEVPGVEVGPPRGTLLDGVRSLIELDESHPLSGEIAVGPRSW